MNELLFYEIVKAILKESTVIQGRFLVAEGYGNDLNANNFDDIIKDALSNFNPAPTKYPVSVMMPPVEIIEKYEEGWSRFKIDHAFLCNTGFSGRNQFKNLNKQTNQSEHTMQQDWKDMREVAGDFRRMFNKILREKGYLKYINSATNAKDYYRRVSKMGNDKLTGVVVSYELNIAMPCALHDYTDGAVAAIQLPAITDFHPLHTH